MGQRLIITEEEKKNIIKLYEAENTPPPSEKELVVANKNPYRYSTYESARRKYSPNLKNGDMFYEQKNMDQLIYFNWNRNSKTTSPRKPNFYYDDIFIPSIVNDLENKTIRVDSLDIILIPMEIECNGKDMYIKFNLPLADGYESYKDSGLLINNQGKYFASREGFGVRSIRKDIDPKVFTKFVQYCTILLTDFNGKIETFYSGNDMSNIPDKYFDIYKIKRVITDF